MKREIVVIAHNIRSAHNIGSLLRTAEGLGVKKVYLTGYSPYPRQKADSRLPYLADKIDRQIHKTSLGAEHSISWEQSNDIESVFKKLRQQGFKLAALEQVKDSLKLMEYDAPERIALILGREVEGLETEVLNHCDVVLEIPMSGQKESFNVVQAAAMALFHLKYVKVA
jgi:tRNA G18 (ribose-2'-O)-methylase SpoU